MAKKRSTETENVSSVEITDGNDSTSISVGKGHVQPGPVVNTEIVAQEEPEFEEGQGGRYVETGGGRRVRVTD